MTTQRWGSPRYSLLYTIYDIHRENIGSGMEGSAEERSGAKEVHERWSRVADSKILARFR